MKDIHDVQRFLSIAEAAATGIAADHGAEPADVFRRWRFALQQSGPSIASGPGEANLALFLCMEYGFPTRVVPVARTRRFTIYDPLRGRDGDYPGAEMHVHTMTDPDDGTTWGRIGFFFHVGNALGARWGRFAARRDDAAGRLVAEVEDMLARPLARETERDEGDWPAFYLNP